MKKLAVLSIALLVLTTLAFAEVKVEPVVAFSGSGTLTWGIDLDDTSLSGFKNENTANLTVTLVSKTTETKGMMAEGDMVYGYIALKDMSLVFNTDNNFEVGDDDDAALLATAEDLDGDADTTDYVLSWDNDGDKVKVLSDIIAAPSIEAYVVLGPAKWFIYGDPDEAISYAGVLEDDTDDDYWAEGEESNVIKSDGGAAGTDFADKGTGIEVALGPATLTALFKSVNDWEGEGQYGFAIKGSVAAGPATLKAGFNMPFASGSTIGFGGSAAVTAGPAAINAAFDGALTGSALAYEIAGGATVTLPDLLTVGANAAFGDVWDLDVEASAELKAVPDLTFKAVLGLWNLTEALAWGVNANVAYKVAMGETNYVKPGVDVYVSQPNGGDLRVALIGKIEAMLIPNTTFTLQYKDKYLTGGDADRLFTFATKVAY